MTHEQKIARWIGPGRTGTEIGPGNSPIPGFIPAPIYVDCFKEFGFEACRADYYGHATALPFHDNSLDYVASSHVLEHVANPVAALAEWYRVLRPGGIIYLVVPDRRRTWDRTRKLTPVEHLLDDYIRGTNACDPTHIDEYAFESDWSASESGIGGVGLEKETLARGMHEAVARGEQINIHFHTFEPENLRDLFETLQTWPRLRFNWEVIDEAEAFPEGNPNGLFLAARVSKGWLDRARAGAFDATAAPDRRAAVVRPDARPFDEFARTCTGLGGVA
ncbi:MAG TPA: class I SAM-dependent methyltransferase [Opitutaceae bacterium]|nr:class I SAM-dependent methyltransferase [Opitutaceae bacterium]